MKLIFTESRTIETAAGAVTLCYELLEDRGSYGVRLINERTGETSFLRDLTVDRTRALEFYEKVLRGQVTPVSLRDIAEDFVAAG